jgi:hypothetical protein
MCSEYDLLKLMERFRLAYAKWDGAELLAATTQDFVWQQNFATSERRIADWQNADRRINPVSRTGVAAQTPEKPAPLAP